MHIPTASRDLWPHVFLQLGAGAAESDNAAGGVDAHRLDDGAVAAVTGQAVPPAPGRRDIDPDPPDQAITSGDLSQVAAVIGQSC